MQTFDNLARGRTWNVTASLLDIVPDRCEGELGPVSPLADIAVFCGNGTSSAVRTAETVHADNEEARGIEGSARTPKERAPPVTDICTAGQGMADDHGIVSGRRKSPSSGVGDGDIFEDDAGFQLERR